MVLSNRSDNFGYSRLGDTAAANVQKADALSSSNHRKPVVTCRHIVKVSCFQCTASFLCSQDIKVFTGKQNVFNCAAVIISVAVQYTALE
jgi:hypothetical protein